MIIKVERTENPRVVENESECKVLRFIPNHEFRMSKGGSPEGEALVYDLFLQASQPVSRIAFYNYGNDNTQRA
jgi:hypothetical protein